MLNLGLKFKSAVRISVSAGVLGVAAWGALSSVAQTGGAAKGDDQTKTQSTPYYCRVKSLKRDGMDAAPYSGGEGQQGTH